MRLSHTSFAFITAFATAASLYSQLVESGFSIDYEFLGTDDIDYQSSAINWESTFQKVDYSIYVQLQNTSVDYDPAGFPIDIVTEASNRSERFFTAILATQYQIIDTLELSAQASISDGFATHNEIWLDEYYRQFWTGRTIVGDPYTEPDPGGYGINLGTRWEYLRSNAFLQFNVSYNRLTIAPGYELFVEGERAGQLVRGIEDLDVLTFDIRSENIITPRLRIENALSVNDTTQRDVRLTYRSGLNYAVTDQFIVRLQGSYATEAPDFDSTGARLMLIYEITDQWAIQATGSYYEDSGEIEQANLATDAAPPLTGYRSTVGLTWTSFDTAQQFHISIGAYDNDYEELQLDQRFVNLYDNRNWLFVKLAYTHTF